MLDDRDQTAAELLIVSNLRFVLPIARRYRGFNQPLGELIQEGNIGLITFVYRSFPAEDGRISQMAELMIKSRIRAFILHGLRMVQIHLTKAQQEIFFRLPKNVRCDFQSLRVPALRAIADQLKVKPRQISHLQSMLAGSEVSLRVLRRVGSGRSAEAVLKEKNGTIEAWEDQGEKEQYFDHMHRAIEKLDQRARDIVCSRWLPSTKRQKLAELAWRYGISGERVRKIESESFDFIRRTWEGDDTIGY